MPKALVSFVVRGIFFSLYKSSRYYLQSTFTQLGLITVAVILYIKTDVYKNFNWPLVNPRRGAGECT